MTCRPGAIAFRMLTRYDDVAGPQACRTADPREATAIHGLVRVSRPPGHGREGVTPTVDHRAHR